MGTWWSFGKSKKEANNPLISGNTRSNGSIGSNGSNGSNGNNKSFRNRKMNKETEDWILLGLVLFSIYFSYYMFKTYFDTPVVEGLENQKTIGEQKDYNQRP